MNTSQSFQEVADRIRPYIHQTPILTSSMLNTLSGASLYFKCENFQRMGAFKMRGAVNAILQLSQEDRQKGVVTHSSGNFAQSLSLAAANLGVPAYIVMPVTAPQVKKEAVIGYGGVITECPASVKEREAAAAEVQKQTGATFIHSSHDPEVIYGQGTAALELLEVQPDLEVIIAPIGGGGLIAGTALAAAEVAPNCRVIGAEPFEVDDAYRSLISGKIESNTTTNTIADGLKVELGTYNFPIISQYVKQIIRVEEAEIIKAMRLIWERMKLVVEPSSAVALAAVLRERKQFAGKKVGIIISGGNVDLEKLPF